MNKRKMNQKDAIILTGILGCILLLLTSPLWVPMIWDAPQSASEPQAVSDSAVVVVEEETIQEDLPVVDETGMTLESRIRTPQGYERVTAEDGSLASFLRTYDLKKSTAVVKTWDGTTSEAVTGSAAVFKLPLEEADLQRSAGSVLRVYAEYFWAQADYESIVFKFSDGFEADYLKWQEGFRIRNDVTGAIWVNGGEYDESEENFVDYMQTVLTYTSIDTLKSECNKINKSDLTIGDILIQTGDISEVAMVVDECTDEDGKRAYLLAKGGSPAMQFHLVSNPAHQDDPWYYEEEMTFPLETSECTFLKGSAYHPTYADIDEEEES